MRALSARERRLVAAGLLVLLLLLVEALVIAPVIEGYAARAQQRALLRQTYARNAGLIATTPALRARADLRKRALARFALAAPNPSLASDQLKERLRSEFGAAGGEVTGVQDVASDAATVRAWVEGRLSLAQLQALLAHIGNAPPFLIVEGLTVSADRSLESGRLETLDVRLEASIPTIHAAS